MQIVNKKSLILINGIPASGKSCLSTKIKQQFIQNNLSCKILSTDKIQAFLNLIEEIDFQKIYQSLKIPEWEQIINVYKLNKQDFNSKSWKISRQIVSNFNMLDYFLNTCQILIIEDQMPLKSQRKVFRKYCSERNQKFLEILLDIPIQQAIQNNITRGKQFQFGKVPETFLKKSYQKFEKNSQDPTVLLVKTKEQICSVNYLKALQRMKQIHIDDNYSKYLAKQEQKHQSSEKQLDESQLRKLISRIIKDDQVSSQYFHQKSKLLSKNQKAQILAEVKKRYIQNKRKRNFNQILAEYLQHQK